MYKVYRSLIEGNICYSSGDYIIEKDSEFDPSRVSLKYQDTIVGNLRVDLTPYILKGVTNYYYKIYVIQIDKEHRGKNLATKMYQCLIDSAKKAKGIVSFLPNRSNKNQIPKIWKKLGARPWREMGEDWEIIDILK